MSASMNANAAKWRTDGVTVVRAASLAQAMPAGSGRATAFEFAPTNGKVTWIGTVTLRPDATTGVHHHGDTEVAVYVAKGRGQIRWGEQIEFAADVGPGDLVYFAPHVPHQERNLDPGRTLEFVVVRSNNEMIAINVDLGPVEPPEWLY